MAKRRKSPTSATTVTATTSATPRIIRTLIEEIVVRVEDDALALVIRWAGGDHTPLRVRKNRAGQHRWGTDAGVMPGCATRLRLRTSTIELLAGSTVRCSTH